MELTQDVVQHRAVVKLHLGVFGHHAVVAGKRGAKGAQALATGIHRAQRFAEKQDGLESFFHQMFGGGGGGLGVIKPDHIAGEVGDFTVDQHHRQGRLLQAVQAILPHTDCVDHDAFHLVAAQQVQVVQLLIELVIGITHQQGEALFPAGCFNAAHDVDRVGIGDIGDDQADEAGSAVLEAAGHQAGAVVEFGNGFFNT